MPTHARHMATLMLLAYLPLVVTAPALAQPATPDPAARQAAELWLGALAAGEYRACWDEAGEMFRAATTAQAWEEQAAAGVQQIGDNVARELAEMRAATDPPGAPPGHYIHIRYLSEFTVAGTAHETIVLVREPERGWRVIGYYVEPPDG